MRVLIVSQYFWPEGFRINDVVKSLVERGIEIDVLTGKPNYPEGRIYSGYRALGCMQESWSEANIFRVPLFPRGGNNIFYLAINYFSFIFFGLVFGPILLRKRKYDIVFVYGLSPILLAIPGVFIAWLKGCNLIVWVQDLWPESLSATGYVKEGFIVGIVRFIVRWIYKHADLLLVQSCAFEAPVAALAPGKSVIYFPNSVDPSFSRVLTKNYCQKRIESLEGGFPVVFAGNVGAAQAVECIVEAATLLNGHPEIRFVIFGHGRKWLWMRDQIQKRGLINIHLVGHFPIESMSGYMQKAGALLVSLSNQPIFALTVPSKIQAYMASGRPIVASLNGEGARLVVESGAGIAVPAEDPKALAMAILALYELPKGEREKMGKNGKLYYQKHFDHDILVSQLVDHFKTYEIKKDVF